MTIRWKKYKILDVNTETHTDVKYSSSGRSDWEKKHRVQLWWMRWDNVDDWETQKLKEYVKEKQDGWFRIPKLEEIWNMLNELWEEAGIMDHQIAMLMYLTGMHGWYWLCMWTNSSYSLSYSRFTLNCNRWNQKFGYTANDDNFSSLCMISGEGRTETP